MYKLHLTIADWLPTSLNKTLRANWRGRHKSNLQWDNYIAAETCGKRPRKPIERARIKLLRHSHRMLDFDGLVGSLKPVVDALVTARVLKDDSWGVLGQWEVDQRFYPKREGTLLEIWVEEIPPDVTDQIDVINATQHEVARAKARC